jgi:hypothetical protein
MEEKRNVGEVYALLDEYYCCEQNAWFRRSKISPGMLME